ncbi:uncharacterized protein SCHCODRAFT_01200310 [Schizophyllum commune H4-8]|nr:uncharacterized protein SCHCODRAFT_01200310 [Schizophyllum commune H4-8]KAI5896870.1 hypothetical protein SCHCODRAFT_01200310 [Schizophyllum commune H4-8]
MPGKNGTIKTLTTDTAASDRVNPSTLDLLDVGSAANTRKRQPQREPTPPHAHPQDKRARLQSHRDPSEDEISNPQQPLDLEEYEVPPPGTPRPEDVDPLNEEDYERTNSEREDARASAVPEGLQDVETQAPRFNPVLHDIQVSLRFIELLKEAALDSTIEPLPADVINQIRNPPLAVAEVDDPDTRYSLELFFALTNASKDEYNNSRAAYLRRHPEGSVLSFYAVKKLVRELSGIVEVKRDMCDNSCIGYTGAYRELDACPYCGESRYEPCPQSGPGSRTKHPRKQFTTLLLGPQIQAQRRGPETSHLMRYRQRCTEAVLEELNANEGVRTSPYRDYIDGAAYLEAVDDGRISPDDSVVVLSMDGAMLYRNKTSDCWIYIWLFMNYDVDVRYKKRFVAIGGTIPGPNKIRNADSFLFTGLHHVAAIQKEGLTVWDAATQRTVTDRPFLHLVTADGPAMAYLDGFVGHHGRIHCRFYCPIVGRHKLGGPHYYPARLRPHNYQVTGCDHDDVDLVDLLASHDSSRAAARYSANLVTVVNSPNMSRYEKNRLETGIVKPSIFSGLPPKRILGIPAMFGGDAMHLPTLNIPDLYISLWRATMDCDTRTDDKRTWPFAVLKDPAHWKVHGKHVGDAIPFTPGSFDRPSRNPAEKISSGYKAWEFLLYFYGHCPCLLFGLLPEAYYVQFCKLARAVRILIEENITPEELAESDELMTAASNGFEELYVQRRADRLHFVRASVHAPSHMPGETERLGPGMIYSQYTMERTIGNLGEEIKQHSNPYANLSERAVRRCQINALKALVPEIEPPTAAEFPASARVLGDGYALLPRRDKITRPTTSAEGRALYAYLEAHGALEDELASIQTTVPKVRRWARLRLPNGQTARSRWKEEKMGLKVRMSRNVKINTASGQRFGEVHYYTLISVNNITHPVAVVSLYGPPHEAIYRLSSKMYVTMQHHRDVDVHVVDARSIASVVLLAPDPRYPLFFKDDSALNRYYLVERPGLGMLSRIGYNYEAPDDGSDNELD